MLEKKSNIYKTKLRTISILHRNLSVTKETKQKNPTYHMHKTSSITYLSSGLSTAGGVAFLVKPQISNTGKVLLGNKNHQPCLSHTKIVKSDNFLNKKKAQSQY